MTHQAAACIEVKMQPRHHNLQLASKKPTATTNSPSNTFCDPQDLGAALSTASEKLTELVEFLQLDSTQPDNNSTCTITDPPTSAENPCPRPSPAITFDTLPNEIRNMIWETALEAEFHDRFVVIDKLDKTVIPFQPTAVSPLLGVNRESRSYALHALPQTIPIRRIDSWVPDPEDLPSPSCTARGQLTLDDCRPSSNITPVADGPACGVFRYSLERDTFIHGPRYTTICQIKPEMLSRDMVGHGGEAGPRGQHGESSAAKMRREPLYLRYISAPLPSLDEAKHVIGWRPLYPPLPQSWWDRWLCYPQLNSKPQTQEEREEEQEKWTKFWPLLSRECLCRGPRSSRRVTSWDLLARHCYCASMPVDEELPLLPRDCLCRGRGRRSREVAVPRDPVSGYCYCVTMPADEELLAEWLVMMSTVGMPWLRMLHREAAQLKL
ncbi:hypothetical protein F4809DRAFT_618300 [Biscogniauxia mediterranea]|nr:hypothetical protein F4809DRAFT_618300 [Biscogniauxia mediterranea]